MQSTKTLTLVLPEGYRDTEFGANGREEFFHRLFGIKYVSDITGFRNLFEQAAAYRGLTSAHLAGKQYKPATPIHAIEQMRKRLLMALTHIEIARIRRDGKRRFGKTKITLVHGLNSNGNVGLL